MFLSQKNKDYYYYYYYYYLRVKCLHKKTHFPWLHVQNTIHYPCWPRGETQLSYSSYCAGKGLVHTTPEKFENGGLKRNVLRTVSITVEIRHVFKPLRHGADGVKIRHHAPNDAKCPIRRQAMYACSYSFAEPLVLFVFYVPILEKYMGGMWGTIMSMKQSRIKSINTIINDTSLI